MSSVSTDPRIGTEFLGYRIEALLGRGGMGVVYRAYDLRLKRNVALKLIAPEHSRDERFRKRFLVETEIAASLEHPGVVPIHDAGEVEGQLYLAMRYVEGRDLKVLLGDEGALAPEQAMAICAQVADALDQAHERGLVHRDVKPSNVLLDSREHAYLADFGLTRRLAEQAPGFEAGLSLGTPAYVAPEQIEGGEVDGRADQYSLGCLLYECLTGEPPFARDSELAVLFAHLEEQPPSPPGLEEVMAKALAKDPQERYGGCGEFVEAAREALGLVTRRSRKATLLAVAGAAVLAGALAAGLSLSLGGGGPARPSTKPTLTPKVASLQRIDPQTNELVATIGGSPDTTAVAVGEGAVWTTSRTARTVSRIDPTTNTVTRVAAGAGPTALAVGEGAVWVVSSKDWTLLRIDPRSLTIEGAQTLPIDCWTCGLAISAGTLWVTDGNAVERLSVSGAPIARIVDPVPISTLDQNIAVGQGAVWVIDDLGLVRIHPARNRITARIEGLLAGNAVIDAGGIAVGAGSVWVTNPQADTVSRFDPATNRLARKIPTGDGPLGIAVEGNAVWVANHGDGTVSRIDPKKGRVVATIEVGPHPTHVAAGEGGVWVTVIPA